MASAAQDIKFDLDVYPSHVKSFIESNDSGVSGSPKLSAKSKNTYLIAANSDINNSLNTSLSSISFDKLSISSVASSQRPSIDLHKATKSLLDIPKITLKSKRLHEHSSKVLSIDWSGDSQQILVSLKSGELCIWDTSLETNIHKVDTLCTWQFASAFSPSQTLIAAGGLDSKCVVYKLPRAKQQASEHHAVAQHQSYILDCTFTSSDHQILTASSDKTSALWDVESKSMIREFKGHTSDVCSLDIQREGYCFVTGSADRNVALWDMRVGTCVQAYNTHTAEVNQVKFFPNFEGVASVSDDLTCRLFDFRMDSELAVYKRKSTLFPALSLDFSLSGRLLFVGYGDHSFRVWDTLKNTHCGSIYAHENKVNALKVSPNGSTIATGSWDQTVHLWTM